MELIFKLSRIFLKALLKLFFLEKLSNLHSASQIARPSAVENKAKATQVTSFHRQQRERQCIPSKSSERKCRR